MASRTASPAHAPSAPGAAARNKASSSSLKPSSTSTPRPASPAAAPAPASPTPGAAAAPLPDLSTLLNLPLRLVLAASGDLPQREIEGSLFTYDASTSYVVLSRPSASSSSSDPPTASKRAYHLVKTSQIKSVAVVSLAPDSSLPSPSAPLRSGVSPSPSDLGARVERAVADDKKARARLGGPGVSEEAQALFDLMGRTMPVRWAATSIVVMDEVVIAAPYQAENVKGAKGSAERVERVRKVLEGIRQRLGNGTATPVLG
ncbi:hypothetical protein JCM1841_005188 [Sporobolomyces salmonicolor]